MCMQVYQNPKQKQCAVGDIDGVIKIIDLQEGKVLKELGDHCLAIRDLKYTEDQTTLISCSEDKHINIIDMYANTQEQNGDHTDTQRQ